MPNYPYHQSLRLQDFTAFHDATLEFVPGVNAFVGENGTGKTHIMKVLYAVQLTGARQLRSISETLGKLFQTTDLPALIRLGTPDEGWAVLRGVYHDQEWVFDYRRHGGSWTGSQTQLEKAERPVFIPAIDMMGHTRGFLQAASEVQYLRQKSCPLKNENRAFGTKL